MFGRLLIRLVFLQCIMELREARSREEFDRPLSAVQDPLVLRLIRGAHLGILVFVLTGWIIPFRVMLKVHLVLVALLIVQWLLMDGICLLTLLEQRLRKGEIRSDAMRGQFIKSLLGKFFDPLPPDRTIKLWLYVLIWSAWGLSALHLIAFVN